MRISDWSSDVCSSDLRPTPPGSRGSRPAMTLLRMPPFLLFVLCGGLNMASHAVLTAFATIHWRAAGIGEEFIGMLWAVGVIAEVAVFAFGGRLLRRLGIVGMRALGRSEEHTSELQ